VPCGVLCVLRALWCAVYCVLWVLCALRCVVCSGGQCDLYTFSSRAEVRLLIIPGVYTVHCTGGVWQYLARPQD
jgi:hypothetical protein